MLRGGPHFRRAQRRGQWHDGRHRSVQYDGSHGDRRRRRGATMTSNYEIDLESRPTTEGLSGVLRLSDREQDDSPFQPLKPLCNGLTLKLS
jgi:hypothetical protein